MDEGRGFGRSLLLQVRLAGLAVMGLVVGPLGGASAGNEDELPVGNRAAMVGGAVTATVGDGSATYYNPAGLGAVDRNRVDVSASAYSLRYYRVPSFLQSDSGLRKDASVIEFVAVPTQVSYVRRLTAGITLGLGYFVPRASDVVLRERLAVPDGQDVSTWSLDLRVSSTTYVLGAALGARLTPRLLVGGGLLAVYEDSVESASVFGSAMRSNIAVRSVQFAVLGTYSRLSAEPGVGLQWRFDDHWTAAFNVRGPRLQLRRTGIESINASAVAPDNTGALSLGVVSQNVTDNAAQRGLLGLGRYHVATSYAAELWSASAEFDVQPGFRSVRTDASRRFTWNARAGMTYKADDDVLLGAGIFTDRDTARDQGNGAVSTRTNFYGATIGLSMDHELSLDEESQADSLVLTTVFALRYAYGPGRSSVLVIDPNAGLEQLFGDDTSRSTTHEVALHVGSALYF